MGQSLRLKTVQNKGAFEKRFRKKNYLNLSFYFLRKSLIAIFWDEHRSF